VNNHQISLIPKTAFLDISRILMKSNVMKVKKFATQIDETALEELRSYSKSTGRSISSVVSEAVQEYLKKARVRPAFRDAMSETLDDHAELLKRLAR
jgi:hypothetical protein